MPGTLNLVGDEFERQYVEYEGLGKGTKVKAREIWYAILRNHRLKRGHHIFVIRTLQILNQISKMVLLNHQIYVQRFCQSIHHLQNQAVCNLASIGLSNFVNFEPVKLEYKSVVINTVNNCRYCKLSKELLTENGIECGENLYESPEDKKEFMKTMNERENIPEDGSVKTFPQIYIDDKRIGGFTELNEMLRKKAVFDYKKLYQVVKVVTKNLDGVIDINFYPIPETKRSNTLSDRLDEDSRFWQMYLLWKFLLLQKRQHK